MNSSVKLVLRARNIPFLVLVFVSLYPVLEQVLPQEKPQTVEWADSLLPTAARDVLLVTADFSSQADDALGPVGLSVVSEIDKSLADMAGLRRCCRAIRVQRRRIVRAQRRKALGRTNH